MMTLSTRLWLSMLLFSGLLACACGSGGTTSAAGAADVPTPGTDLGPRDPAPDAAGEDGLRGPDLSPPELAVIETWLAEESVPAGSGPVSVTCMGYDAQGNYVGAGPCHLEADAPVVVDGLTVATNVAGSYAVRCVPDDDVEVELVEATLAVVPGPPVAIDITPKPAKEFYVVGASLTLSATGEDAHGNAIDEVPLEGIAVTPGTLAKVVLGKVTFVDEGSGTISAHAESLPSVKDAFPVQVDGGAPVLTISTPKRASQLLGPGPVTVEGSVVDATGLKSVTLNGTKLTLDSEGDFSTTVPGAFGLNLLRLEAEDILGNRSRRVQGFTLASRYYPVVDGSLEDLYVDGGIVAWLDYDAFKGVASEEQTTLSYIAQEFLLALDLAGLIPSPVAVQKMLTCTYTIFLSDLTHGPPEIELWPLPDGLTVHVRFPDLAADLLMEAPWCPDVSGTVSATAVTLDALLAVTLSPSGDLDMEMTSVEVQFVGLDIELDGVTGALVGLVLGFFEEEVAAIIEEQFEAQVKDQVESQLEQLLGNLSVDQWIELPPFLPSAPATPAEIHLRGAGIETAYGGARFDIDGAFTTNGIKQEPLLGALARDGCMTGDFAVPKVTTQHYLEVALHDDVLNQSVFTKYFSGGIDFVLDQEGLEAMGNDFGALGVENLKIVANSFLPPVMSDCHPDGKYRIQLGELRLKISLTMVGMPLEMTLYLYFSAQSDFQVTGVPGAQQIQFTFGEVDWIDYHIDEVNEEWKGKEALFGELIEETFLAEFVASIQKYPYTIQVSAMPVGDLLPAFSGWTFVPVIDSIQRKPGHLLVRAHLALEP
jgi:hypothetical protein